MRELRPIRLRPKFYEDIEKETMKIFTKILFNPIVEIVKKYVSNNFKNSSDVISQALNDGVIQFSNGEFSGRFSAKISKELINMGAKFNREKKVFSINQRQLPPNIQSAIAVSSSRFQSMHDEIIYFLDSLSVETYSTVGEFEDLFTTSVLEMNADISKTIPKTLGVQAEITRETAQAISRDFVLNMDLSINNFLDDEIKRLRADVIDNTFNGMRSTNLIKSIQKNYGVTESKARFLARQETSLLMSSFRENKYKQSGITKYKWSTSNDVRVRQSHKDANGKVFSWDNPPAVGYNGERNHPGEDFNCRCVAIPILEV